MVIVSVPDSTAVGPLKALLAARMAVPAPVFSTVPVPPSALPANRNMRVLLLIVTEAGASPGAVVMLVWSAASQNSTWSPLSKQPGQPPTDQLVEAVSQAPLTRPVHVI